MTPRFDPPMPVGDTPLARAQSLIDWAREARLLYPGGGLDLRTSTGLTYDVAQRSGSAGLILAMHLSQAYTLAWVARNRPELARILEDLVVSGGLIASVVSEPKSRGDILGGAAEMQPSRGRVRIEKQTFNTSYVPSAGAFLVSALDAKGTQRLALALPDQTERTAGAPHAMMGMQGIDNRPWHLIFDLPEGQVFTDDFAALSRQVMTPATHILWAACWSGIAAGALAKADQSLRGSKTTETALQLASLSALRMRQAAVTTALREALDLHLDAVSDTMDLSTQVTLNRLKILASEEAVAVVLGALQIIGFQGYLEDGPLSVAEALRDCLSGPLMVSNQRLRAQIGKLERFVDLRP